MIINREYKRDVYNNYMVLPALEEDRFEARMLMENQIEGIMRIQIRSIDDEEYYYYDISSKQPIANLFERGQLGYEQIKSIISGIIQAIEEGSSYLLNENDYILDTEYIYITLSSFSVSLCYLPGYNCDLSLQLTGVIEYLMDKADHTDEKAVMFVYGMYKAAKQGCTLVNLKSMVCDNDIKDYYFNSDVDNDSVRDSVRDDYCQREQYKSLDDRSNHFERGMHSEEDRYVKEDEREAAIRENSIDKQMDNNRIDKLPYMAGGVVAVIIIVLAYFSGIIFDSGGNISLIRGGCVVLIGIGAVWATVNKLSDAHISVSGYGEGAASRTESDYCFHSDISGMEEIHKEEKEAYLYDESEYENETMLLADYRRKEESFELVSVQGNSYEGALIKQTPFIIGKLKDKVDFLLMDDRISRLHAKIDVIDDGQMTITDLNSTNGTYINGERLLANETRKIFRGDEIGFADLLFNLH